MRTLNVIDKLLNGFKLSGFLDIISEKNMLNMYEITLKKTNEFKIHAFVRSIGSSGWRDKKDIRRVQIAGFDPSKLPISNDNRTAMIIGVESIFDKNIFVVWNIYNYGSHKKNRSCYIKVSNLFKGFLQGYLTTTDSNQKIWVSDEYHLDKLLKDYLAFNYCSLGDQHENII